MASPEPDVLIARLRKSLDRYRIRQGKVFVAVSGGPDSIAVLQALQEVAERYALTVVAGHLNHKLRGAESEADADFVDQFCRQRDVLCLLGPLHPGDLSFGRSHLESTARGIRYRWLEYWARQEGCSWLMTGHTADDQAETVLHHLVRGTGLRGLRGIAPWRRVAAVPGKPPLALVRPLLQTTRAEVTAFLASRGIHARHDRSNDDLRFTRNRLRHVVLPMLCEQINSHAALHLAQLAERAREFYPLVRRKARRLLRDAELPAVGDVLVLDQRVLTRADPTTLQEALLQLWSRQQWSVAKMSAKHWREVMEVCMGERPQVQLARSVVVRRKLHVVHFLLSEAAY